jgi:flagellar hook protein FlgE
MPLSFSTSLSGLNSDSNAINDVSQNLANLNTTGYKAEQVSFEDLVNQSLSALSSSLPVSGSTIAKTSQQFSQGTLQTTGGAYDAAIQGGGFFVLSDPSTGAQLFTRDGGFSVNSSGNLVTAAGQNVMGWNAVGGTLSTSGPASAINVPPTLIYPGVATTNMTLSLNLNANAAAGSTFSSPIQVFDAQGVAHTLTVTYTEAAANDWNYQVTIPTTDIPAGSSPILTSGTLNFDGTGTLIPPTPPTVAISIPALADGASAMNINWNLTDAAGNPTITQNNQASTNLGVTQDGSQPAQLASVAIGDNGAVVASFSNGTTESVGQIELASISNPSTMTQLDNGTYAVTTATSTPVFGMPGSGARGTITGGALETSTVDIATEFTNLLQFERGYQANSKVITTEDQVIQTTLSLITG